MRARFQVHEHGGGGHFCSYNFWKKGAPWFHGCCTGDMGWLASYMQGAGRITTHDKLTCAETMKAGVLKRWRSSEKLSSFCSRQLLPSCWTSPSGHPSRFQSLDFACVQSITNRREADWAKPMAASSHLRDVLPAWQTTYF